MFSVHTSGLAFKAFLIWGDPALKTVKEEPPLWKKEASGVCVMARRLSVVVLSLLKK